MNEDEELALGLAEMLQANQVEKGELKRNWISTILVLFIHILLPTVIISNFLILGISSISIILLAFSLFTVLLFWWHWLLNSYILFTTASMYMAMGFINLVILAILYSDSEILKIIGR